MESSRAYILRPEVEWKSKSSDDSLPAWRRMELAPPGWLRTTFVTS